MAKKKSKHSKGSTPQPAPQNPKLPPLQQIPAPQPDANEKPTLLAALNQLETARGNPAIVYWTGAQARISDAAIIPLYDQLAKIGKVPALDLVLYTPGGDTEIPWRIVTLIREYAERLTVLVPHRAHSAGTLIALGADEIIMTPLAVLGPIDPSRTHPLLPRREGADEAEPVSVQDMRHAMQFIREAGGLGPGTGYTPEALAQIYSALFDKIHPLAIGAIEQSYALSKLVGKRCMSTHMDAETEAAEIERIVDRLCDDYKSHQYQIGRAEAREIGLKVTDADPDVEKALLEILMFYSGRASAPPVMPPTGKVQMFIAWLDSAKANFRVESILEADGNKLNYLGDQWVVY